MIKCQVFLCEKVMLKEIDVVHVHIIQQQESSQSH
jgi:hypothetical protein